MQKEMKTMTELEELFWQDELLVASVVMQRIEIK